MGGIFNIGGAILATTLFFLLDKDGKETLPVNSAPIISPKKKVRGKKKNKTIDIKEE